MVAEDQPPRAFELPDIKRLVSPERLACVIPTLLQLLGEQRPQGVIVLHNQNLHSSLKPRLSQRPLHRPKTIQRRQSNRTREGKTAGKLLVTGFWGGEPGGKARYQHRLEIPRRLVTSVTLRGNGNAQSTPL